MHVWLQVHAYSLRMCTWKLPVAHVLFTYFKVSHHFFFKKSQPSLKFTLTSEKPVRRRVFHDTMFVHKKSIFCKRTTLRSRGGLVVLCSVVTWKRKSQDYWKLCKLACLSIRLSIKVIHSLKTKTEIGTSSFCHFHEPRVATGLKMNGSIHYPEKRRRECTVAGSR